MEDAFLRKRARKSLIAIMMSVFFSSLFLSACDDVKRAVIERYPKKYSVASKEEGFSAQFDGPDAKRERIPISLRKVASGLSKITDIRFLPGSMRWMIVLQKEGKAVWVDLETGAHHPFFEQQVPTASEQGLLGLSFYPDFEQHRRFVVNASAKRGGKRYSQISVWTLPSGDPPLKAVFSHTLLEVEQPYANHNGGCLAFGPDGMLYIGFGDGGWRADPHHNGQNGQTFLGSMLRIDVRDSSPERPYRIPEDNPFVGKKCCRPEVYAIGLRNPWRFSFGPGGELIVGDVGQDKWEEIDLIPPGANAGWPIMEARHCFEPASGCKTEGLLLPIHEYPRSEGISVTGGYVYRGDKVKALKNQYVFGDFGSGRLWALTLPSKGTRLKEDTASSLKERRIRALGRWPILISTFGIDHEGEIYLADYQNGDIYKIEPSH